jgi:signal transduction histidine kinase
LLVRHVSTLRHVAWNRIGHVPLRTKIFGIVIAATSLTASGVLLWIHLRWIMPSDLPSSDARHFDSYELLAAALIAMTVGLIVAWILTSILAQQVTKLTQIALKVQNGDLSQRAPIWASDEIGALAQAFNTMIDSLTRSSAVRARLLATAVNAQEQERERISRELHDETGQALTALLLQIKVLERLHGEEAITAQAAELRKLVLTTLEEIRRLARDLRPGTLDELGLVPTIEWHLRTFGRNPDLKVELEASLPEGFRLPIHTELALYRVIQEGLTNIVRHAGATQALIRLEIVDGYLRLTIQDNGCGFDVPRILNADERGVGLLGIQERVELIGGTLMLESSGQGTFLCVEMPVPGMTDRVENGEEEVIRQ